MGLNTKMGKISPLKREYASDVQTIASSLAKNGLTRWPGTGRNMCIQRCKKTGVYLTGLDENADYLKQMSPEEREAEISRIKEWKSFIISRTGLSEEDLSPNGSYYRNMAKHWGELNGEMKAVQPYKMIDGENHFNLEDPYKLITFCWLRVHPHVAPSRRAWELGKCSPACEYFVDNAEYEAEETFKMRTEVNKAIAQLTELSPVDRKKIGILLGLPIHPGSTEEAVYNALDDYIKESEKKNGHNLTNIKRFKNVLGYQQETLNVRYYVKMALHYNIYRLNGSEIYDGQTPKGMNEEEMVKYLLSPKNMQELSILQDKLKEIEVRETV